MAGGELVALALVASGVVLMSVYFDSLSRWLGAGLAVAGFVVWTTPAHADQALTVQDNGGVDCIVSARDLTRISLVGDEFASVSKVQALSPADDFNVVNEPTRGDIYVGIPDTFKRKSFSFFGTSKHGFVYKFSCRVEQVDAQQIFLTNPQVASVDRGGEKGSEGDGPAPDLDESAIRLVQGMATQQVVPGFHMERVALVPVKSGDLSVQLVSEYQGLDLVGRVVRIENTGSKPVLLSEAMVAPRGALAVSIAQPNLQAHQSTAVYVVLEKNGAR